MERIGLPSDVPSRRVLETLNEARAAEADSGSRTDLLTTREREEIARCGTIVAPKLCPGGGAFAGCA